MKPMLSCVRNGDYQRTASYEDTDGGYLLTCVWHRKVRAEDSRFHIKGFDNNKRPPTAITKEPVCLYVARNGRLLPVFSTREAAVGELSSQLLGSPALQSSSFGISPLKRALT